MQNVEQNLNNFNNINIYFKFSNELLIFASVQYTMLGDEIGRHALLSRG